VRAEGWDSIPGTLAPDILSSDSLMNRLASRILRSQGARPFVPRDRVPPLGPR